MASMQILRLHYRDRSYRVNVATSRAQEATWKRESLQIRFLGHRHDFQHGEFDAIAQAFECFYQYPNLASQTITSHLTLRYLRIKFIVTVPLSLFFHATVQLRELFLADDVRAEHVSVADFRSRFDRRIIIGSPFSPSVFAWKQVWTLPPRFSRPMWRFQDLISFLAADVWQSSHATSTGFELFWVVCLKLLDAGDLFCDLQYTYLGRIWALTVAREDALEASASIDEFEMSWAPIQQRFRRKMPLSIPPALQFGATIATDASMPAAIAPSRSFGCSSVLTV